MRTLCGPCAKRSPAANSSAATPTVAPATFTTTLPSTTFATPALTTAFTTALATTPLPTISSEPSTFAVDPSLADGRLGCAS